MTAKETALSRKIKACRQNKNLKQEQLAEILRKKYGLGTTREAVSKWEIGFQAPEMTTIKYLAEIFGITIDELNEDESERERITRQTLKDEDKILLDLWGKIGEDEQKFFRQQLERAAKERRGSNDD